MNNGDRGQGFLSRIIAGDGLEHSRQNVDEHSACSPDFVVAFLSVPNPSQLGLTQRDQAQAASQFEFGGRLAGADAQDLPIEQEINMSIRLREAHGQNGRQGDEGDRRRLMSRFHNQRQPFLLADSFEAHVATDVDGVQGVNTNKRLRPTLGCRGGETDKLAKKLIGTSSFDFQNLVALQTHLSLLRSNESKRRKLSAQLRGRGHRPHRVGSSQQRSGEVGDFDRLS